jgi:hypothetical protein
MLRINQNAGSPPWEAPDRLSGTSHVRRVFFVVSTGRCGTKYLANLLNLAENGAVVHEPTPGCEPINPIAYEIFIKDRAQFDRLRVSDFPLLRLHASFYEHIHAEVFGDCYNSLYPFAIALYHFFTEMQMDIKFIHLLRHPVDTCSSILRAEGPHGRGTRKNFGLRAKLLSQATHPADIASDVWININEVIRYELKTIEHLHPSSTRTIRIEDMSRTDHIRELYRWLGLQLPEPDRIKEIIDNESYGIRHSHQVHLDSLGVPRITDQDLEIIKHRTEPFLGFYGYQ